MLQLRMTYQIVQLHSKITNEAIENADEGKRKMIRTLVLAELTEGVTPLIYAICFVMAY